MLGVDGSELTCMQVHSSVALVDWLKHWLGCMTHRLPDERCMMMAKMYDAIE
jgi:hypothetical protein